MKDEIFTPIFIKVFKHSHDAIDVKEMNAKGATLMDKMMSIPFSQEFFDIKSPFLSKRDMVYTIENQSAQAFVTFNAKKMQRLIQFIIHPTEPSFQIRSTTDMGDTLLNFNRDRQGGLLVQFSKSGKSHAIYLPKEIIPYVYEAMRIRWIETKDIRF